MIGTLQYALGGLSGTLVGFVLGLVGGGGSILAVPLLLYLVGVKEPHVAIGTSAFAVAANAAIGLWNHARAGTVNWRCGFIYAATGVVGAFGGSTLGKSIDGNKLLLLFAILMIVVSVLMFKRRGDEGIEGAQCSRENFGKVASYGFGTGIFSGFFGIGGGFLIVPGLVASTSMPILRAIGTSLIAVTAFGLTTSFNYALSGLVNWPLAGVFVVGGVIGSALGTRASRALSADKGKLNTVFAGFVMIVALYMLWKSWGAIVA
jgi:hypothetical protein